jgi:hypothetical protein
MKATSERGMNVMKCQCQDPSCAEHPEKYKCRRVAVGTLSQDADSYEMDLCAGCAANDLTTLELGSTSWVLIDDNFPKPIADLNMWKIQMEDMHSLPMGSLGGNRDLLLDEE